MDQNQNGQKCVCPHHYAVPILIVLLGLVFLLNDFAVISAGATAIAWPIIIILIGLQKIFQKKCKCC